MRLSNKRVVKVKYSYVETAGLYVQILQHTNTYAPDPEKSSIEIPFFMSLESVRDRCPPVYHVLRLLSLFDPEKIPQFHL